MAGLILVGAGLASADVPRATSVLGVDVGSRSRAEAAATLSAELAQRANDPIRVRAGTKEQRVEPARAGLSFDAVATADAAAASGSAPGPLRHLAGGGEVEPVVRVDEPALARTVAGLAREVDVPAQERTVRFSGLTPALTEAAPGRVLDHASAQQRIRDAYLRGNSRPGAPVELPMRTAEPTISEQEARRALEQTARGAVAAPVTLRSNGSDVEVSPHLIARTLRFEAVEGRLVPRVDGPALAKALGEQLDGLEREARDASVRTENDRPVIVPAVDGQGVDEAALGAAVADVLQRPGNRVVETPLTSTPPELTTADVEALNITDKLSSYTQRFPAQAYRIRNITTAARYLDGTVISPDEVFSMNETVKERNAENGYVVGKVIASGRLRKDYGGGVSTITTAVWDAAFHAGLTRIEQRGHSYWIPRYKPGLEATVAWGQLDLKVRNDSSTPVLMTASVTDRSVTISMWGRKEYDITSVFGPKRNVRPFEKVYDPGSDCVSQAGRKGFDIDVTRVFSKEGTVVKKETFTTKYNSALRVRCRPAPGES
ncbi:MAG: VanW family protein [Actinomycetota bacterium]|nr:VanW family protein [Actinomycetota bacterium]